MVDYNRLFKAHNGDDAWELLKEAYSTKRRDKHHEMLLVVDESSLEKHMRGSQYQRMILASSGKTVTISQRHELKVIRRLSQARPGPPSGRPQGEVRQVDVGASIATGIPMTLCYSPVYPHSPHTPHISIWGSAHTQDGPGAKAVYTNPMTPEKAQAANAWRRDLGNARGMWVAAGTTHHNTSKRRKLTRTEYQGVQCGVQGIEASVRFQRELQFTKKYRKAKGPKRAHGPTKDRLLELQCLQKTERQSTEEGMAAAIGAEWQYHWCDAVPDLVHQETGTTDCMGTRQVQYTAKSGVTLPPGDAISGEHRCGNTVFQLVTNKQIVHDTG